MNLNTVSVKDMKSREEISILKSFKTEGGLSKLVELLRSTHESGYPRVRVRLASPSPLLCVQKHAVIMIVVKIFWLSSQVTT